MTSSMKIATLGGKGRRHHNHRAKGHDAGDQEDCDQSGTAPAAVQSQAHAVSPCRAGIGR